MIQRIQTLYLFLTTLMSLLFLKGSFLNFINNSGSLIKVTFIGAIKYTEGQGPELIDKLLPLSAIIILIPVISLIAIAFFKKRKIQMGLVLFVIILIIGFIIGSILYSTSIMEEYGAELVPGFKLIVPAIILILAVLAYRGIRKDDRLVKSYDRLR